MRGFALWLLITFALGLLAFGLAFAFGWTQEAEPQAQAQEVAAPPAPPKPRLSYAQRRGCRVTHPSRRSYRKVRKMLRHHQPLRPIQRRRSKHYAVCVATRKKSRAVWRFVRRSYGWRGLYAHYWPIQLNRLPAWTRSWAEATAWCESDMGQNPRTNLNGFRGRFQWVMSTWYGAGGRGDPAAASYEHEAVIAIGLMLREGAGHWPNCG